MIDSLKTTTERNLRHILKSLGHMYCKVDLDWEIVFLMEVKKDYTNVILID